MIGGWLWILGVFLGVGLGSLLTAPASRFVQPRFKRTMAGCMDPMLQPRCTCRHWFNEHQRPGGRCHHKGCRCQHYLGPEPEMSGLWSAPQSVEAAVEPGVLSLSKLNRNQLLELAAAANDEYRERSLGRGHFFDN